MLESQAPNSPHDKDREIRPRERFLSAVERRPCGGVSLDLGFGITSFTVGAHEAICRDRGLPARPPEISARMLNIVYPTPELEDCCCGDLRFVAPGPPLPGKGDVELDEQAFRDEWDLSRRMPQSGHYYDFFDPPLEACRTLEECLTHLRRPEDADQRVVGMRKQAEVFRDRGYAVGSWCFAGIFEMVFWLRGYKQAYLDFGANPGLAEGLMDALLEIQLEFWTAILDELNGTLDVALLTEDLGTQSGLMISPRQFRALVKPRIGQLIHHIKHMSPSTKVLLHSDGAVFPLIADFIEMGVDILNPLQPGAAGMDPARIKEEFGDDLSFHGAIDIQELLRTDCPDRIRASIQQMVERLGRGGGYVVAPAHCIQPDVPPQNVIAMVNAVRELEGYP